MPFRLRNEARAHSHLLGFYAVGLLALALPLVTVLTLAKSHVQSAQLDQTQTLAQSLLDHTHAISEQIRAAGDALQSDSAGTPCSPARQAQMRQLLANNPLLMDIGWMQQNWLVCSALAEGRHNLGAPTSVSAQQRQLRADIFHPLNPKGKMLVTTFSATGDAVMVRIEQALQLTPGQDHTTRALINISNLRTFASKGAINPAWLDRLRGQSALTFVDGGHTVSWQASPQWDYGVLVAVPLSAMDASWRTLLLWLVPSITVAALLLLLVLVKLARHQASLEAAIRSGLKRHEFHLVYQPIVSLQTGAWVGAEALLRWQRGSGEEVSPQVFIPVAESHGFMRHITARVLELFARDAATLFPPQRDFFVALNLSATDLCEPDMATEVLALLQRTGLQPRNVHVEATESVFLDIGQAQQTLKALRDAHIAVAIDDFGTGYSSLSYLTHLTVDVLKIDKSFVDTIGTDSVAHQVVDHIIELGKSLQLDIVAEGVETPAQAEYLRAKGVHYAQGWLFAKPMSCDALAKRLLHQQPSPSA